MALSNYTEIADAIAAWLNREGFTSVTDRVADFITLSQQRIQRDVRVPAMESIRDLTVNEAGEASVPSGYLEAKYLIVTDGNYVYQLTRSTYPQVKLQQVSNVYNQPSVYDVEGQTIYVGALPQAGHVFTLVYYKVIDFISPDNAENWFTEGAPELILYGALSEAALFMKDFELASVYEGKFQDAKEKLEMQAKKNLHSGSPLAVRSK